MKILAAETSLNGEDEGRLKAIGEGSTRNRVLELLLSDGPLSAPELANRLGITSAGVRRHIQALAADGSIELARIDNQNLRRGRPPQRYKLTLAGRRCFEQATDELAKSAIAELIALTGAKGLQGIAKKRLDSVAISYRRLRAESPELKPWQALAQALDQDGYRASWRSETDQGDVYQYHCPVVSVASDFPELCEAETKLLAQLIGSQVERVDTIAEGGRRCQLHIVDHGASAKAAPAIAKSRYSEGN